MESATPLGLRASEPSDAPWKLLFDACPDPLMFVGADYRVVCMNAAQAQALGCRAEEVVGRFCYDVMHGSTGPIARCLHTQMMQSQRELSNEVMVDRLGGRFNVTVTPVSDAAGRLIGTLHIARPLIEEPRAQGGAPGAADSHVRRSEARAKELHNRLRVNQTLVGIIQRLSPYVHAVDFQERIQRELAFTVETLKFARCVFWRGQHEELKVLACAEDRSARLPPLPGTATRENAPHLFGSRHHAFSRSAAGGVVRCVVRKSVPGPDATAIVFGVECLEQSESCDVLYEDALCLMCEIIGGLILQAAATVDTQKLRLKLFQADRVARLGQLTATLAHELNQPLAATLCNAQAAERLLAQKPPDVQEARLALDDIVEAARQAGAIVRKTRALFKGAQLSRQPLVLNHVIKSVVELMRGDFLLAGAFLTSHLDAALPPVLGDETQLQQVLRNLLVNACDAVRAEPVVARNITVRTGLDSRGFVELCVQDSGVGFPEGMEEKIFEPFYTSKSDGQGMGLPICRQIMQAHGGNICAVRVAEGGTLFRVTLPVYHEDVAEYAVKG